MIDFTPAVTRCSLRLAFLLVALALPSGIARAQSLEDLLRDVASDDAGARQAAVESLHVHGVDAVAPLAKLLASESPAVVRAARRALESIAHHAARPAAEKERASVSAALAAQCEKAESGAARRAILDVLGYVGGEEAVGAVVAVLDDPRTHDAACRALARIPDSSAARALAEALADAGDRTETQQIAIINAIGLKEDDATAQALSDEVENAESEEIRLAALEALSKNPMSYAYVHLFWSALPKPEDDRPRARRRVWDSMMRIGRAFVANGEVGAASDFGCELLDVASTTAEKCSAIVALSHAGRRFAPERIFAALDDENPQVRAAARSGLSRLRGLLVIPTLKERLEGAAPERQVELLGILAHREEPEAAPLAATRLDHESEAVRAAALRALEKLGGPEAVSALVDALEEGSPVLREGAVGVLGRVRGEGVTQAIIDRAKTAKAEVRAALLRALGRRADPKAKEFLRESARSS